ncbi:MAG: hypothetical protein ACRDTR_02450, partial [Rubrobacter sp.]
RYGFPAGDRPREPQDPEEYPDDERDVADSRPQPRRDHPRRATSDEDIIPELPQDLFDWPEAPGDFGTRGRRKGRSLEDQDEGDQPDTPEGPRP